VTAVQSRAVRLATALLDAYNRGDQPGVLALLAPEAVWSDCDYRSSTVVQWRGSIEIGRWLTRAFADHDRLVLSRIDVGEPKDGVVAVGLSYRLRTSEALRVVGAAGGIEPPVATKVVCSLTPLRVMVFANGPVGGSASVCSPG